MWNLRGSDFHFSWDGFDCLYDVSDPARGIFDCRLHDQPLTGLAALELHDPQAVSQPADFLIDHYVRDDDLVATYVQAPSRGNRKQVYVRRAGFGYASAPVGVELIFSTQTQRLDGEPELQLRTQSPAARAWSLVDRRSPRWEPLALEDEAVDLSPHWHWGAVAIELPSAVATYVQLLHPTDFAGARWLRLEAQPSAGYRLVMPVFRQLLEKGVIRRGRVTGLFFQGASGLEAALAFWEWYAQADPPLTA